jgi:hypothetical protein
MALTRSFHGPSKRAVGPLFVVFSALALGGALSGGCGFDWESYDPRLGTGSASASSGPGSGGGGGGASSTTSGDPGGTGGSSSSGAGGETGSGGAGGASGTGGETGSGGMGGSGGGEPVPCGGTNVLSDDFADGQQGILWYWSNNPSATISEANGQGIVAMPSGSMGTVYAAFQTKRVYDLRNDSVSVEVTQVANTATSARTFLTIARDDQNYLELAQEGGSLYCERVVNGATLTLIQLQYNAVTHRYWRIREDGTTTYWETSDNGSSWVVRAQVPTAQLFPLSSVRVDIGSYLHGGEVNPGQARFDNVNGGGAPAGKWCPPTVLTDDFQDPSPSRSWLRSYEEPGCTLTETGGQLVAKLPVNLVGYCAYISSASYDLTESEVVIEVPSMVNTATLADAFLRIESEGEGYLEFVQSEGMLEFRREKGGMGVTLGGVLYNPANHRWWRVREKGGITFYEHSSDGMAWQIGAQEATALDVTAIDIHIGGGTYQGVAAPGEVHFDNFNLTP